MPAKRVTKDEGIAAIDPANYVSTTIRIRGTAPHVQAKFSTRDKELMKAAMTTPRNERKGKAARPPRDFDQDFIDAQHRTVAGWNGVPCGAYRRAMIDACRTVGLVMVRAKLAVWVYPDGFDMDDGTPLVRLYSPQPPERMEILVRLDNGSADIRVRPMWREWYCDVRVGYDADMITGASVVNLLDRAGHQVGVGEGRPFSKNSTGMGWGTFAVETIPEEAAA